MTITDSLDIIISSHREGVGMCRALAIHTIEMSPTCEEVAAGTWTVAEAEKFHLADALKAWIEGEIDDMPVKTFRDAIRATLARDAFEEVDWHELAAHYLNVVREG